MQKKLPLVKFGDKQITRLLSGANPICCNSHFNMAMNLDMQSYFTTEQVVRYLHDLQRAGIDTIQARGDYHRIMYWLELFKREGGELQWIAQTASEMADIFSNIRVIAAAGAIGIYNHGSQTDSYWYEGKIDKINDHLKCMRDCGVQVGLGTHIPQVIEYSEEKGWDVDFYMASFYNPSLKPRESYLASNHPSDYVDEVFSPDNPPAMCKVIQSTDKMCLAFKILGASRSCATQEDVKAAFKFAFDNIKPTDAVVVGMFPKYEDQIALNVQYTIDACSAI